LSQTEKSGQKHNELMAIPCVTGQENTGFVDAAQYNLPYNREKLKPKKIGG
jgi:hypothetical protein